MKMWISGATTFWLAIIGTVAMISGALSIKYALLWMSQRSEELYRDQWRMTKKGGIIIIRHVGPPHDYQIERPDECKPDAKGGRDEGA